LRVDSIALRLRVESAAAGRVESAAAGRVESAAAGRVESAAAGRVESAVPCFAIVRERGTSRTTRGAVATGRGTPAFAFKL
jgi:hypothetical protein